MPVRKISGKTILIAGIELPADEITKTNNMPVRKISGGYQWGTHGKIYRGKGAKKKAAKQGRAAFANGYRGKR